MRTPALEDTLRNARLASRLTPRQRSNYLRFVAARRGAVVAHGPIRLSVVATGACNLRCAMCHTHSPEIPEDYAHRQGRVRACSLGLFRDVVDRHDTPLLVELIGGGEPLLNRDLFAMAEYATVHKRMRVVTFSNGLLAAKLAPELARSHLAELTVSLNGHDASEYLRMTGQAAETFETIKENLRSLVRERDRVKRSGLLVRASFILDRVNYVHVPRMLALASTLGVDRVIFHNFLHTPFPGLTAPERAIFTHDREIVASIRRSIAALPRSIRLRVIPPQILERPRVAETRRCDLHHTQLRVDADGSVSSCSMMLLNMKGNGHVFDDQVWNNRFFTDMRRRFLDPEQPLPEPCTYCPRNVGRPLEPLPGAELVQLTRRRLLQ